MPYPTYIVFIKEHIQLSDADAEISFIELIANIPSERSELSPFLNNRVEEAKGK